MLTVKRALEFAKNKHKGQVDKSGAPYIGHPIRVARKLKSIDEKIVALLHDVLEDTDATFEELGNLGASDKIIIALQFLTHNENISYEEYIRGIAQNSIARAVKLADLADNTDPDRMAKLPEKIRNKLKEKYKLAYAILNEEASRMDTKESGKSVNIDYEVEMENAEKAFDEFLEKGDTSRHCLRCGGNFIFQEAGSGYSIRCEKENCFKMTVRGI